MDTDNAFETLIELLSTPIMILLDEQENGGKYLIYWIITKKRVFMSLKR